MSTASYAVSGMTCGHCVAAVTEEVTKIEGVTGVEVTLVSGGQSTVAVASDMPLAAESVRAAVDEAGYELTSVSA